MWCVEFDIVIFFFLINLYVTACVGSKGGVSRYEDGVAEDL